MPGRPAAFFFLDLPESSPFIRTNGAEEAVAFLEHYDASYRAGPLVSLAVGGEYKAFGRNLFTEASGFHTSHGSRHVNVHSSPTEPWTDLVTAFTDTYCKGNITRGMFRVHTGQRAGVSAFDRNRPAHQICRLDWSDRRKGGGFRHAQFRLGRSRAHHDGKGTCNSGAAILLPEFPSAWKDSAKSLFLSAQVSRGCVRSSMFSPMSPTGSRTSTI